MAIKEIAQALTLVLVVGSPLSAPVQAESTYAERLGWPEGARVVMFHSDDLGMHHDSVVGTIDAIENGVVTSTSTMMPCSWVPLWNRYLQENPDFDNGLHLTLNSEWTHYRWGPVAGRDQVPSLIDPDGYLWRSVPQVVEHADPDDVEREIRAQIRLARQMGMPVTHLDSHMGALFASTTFLERYVKVGIEEQIPIMIPGGHMTHILSERPDLDSADQLVAQVRGLARKVWSGGLPVLDDLQTDLTGQGPYERKKEELIRRLRDLKPGITMIIVHCTQPSEVFPKISGSGSNRLSDTRVMTSPDIRRVLEEEGIVLTTWREMKERRDRLGR